jgi:hypothetical protein
MRVTVRLALLASEGSKSASSVAEAIRVCTNSDRRLSGYPRIIVLQLRRLDKHATIPRRAPIK